MPHAPISILNLTRPYSLISLFPFPFLPPKSQLIRFPPYGQCAAAWNRETLAHTEMQHAPQH